MKKIYILIWLTCFALQAQAQQDPHYSQYMFNGLVLNPAYAGSRDQVSANLLYRRQWTGIEGAPSTQSFGIHGPSRNLRHGFGLSLYNDAIGVVNQLDVNLAYAFRIETGEHSHLALGLQGSLMQYRADYTSIRLDDAVDPSFDATNSFSILMPNAGAGLYFNSRSLYAGVSVPHLIANDIGGVDASQAMHVFGTAGVVLSLGESLKFKPSTMVKYVPGAPVSLDLNGNIFFRDRIAVGAGYRLDESLVMMIEIWPTKQLRLGYAYDYLLNDLNTVSNGSHEFMLGFDFSFDKKKVISPRYF